MKITRNNSFAKFKFLAVLLAVGLVFGGCDANGPKQRENSLPQSIAAVQANGNSESVDYASAKWSVDEFRSRLSNDLERVGVYLREHNATFQEAKTVSAALSDVSRDQYLGVSGESASANVQRVTHYVETAVRGSGSYQEFQEKLATKLRQVQKEAKNKNWSEQERRAALAHIVVVQETMEFAKRHPQLVGGQSSLVAKNGIFGWFKDNWKCVAGAVGGGLAGAIGGGGVLGAIAGALTGAAGSC